MPLMRFFRLITRSSTTLPTSAVKRFSPGAVLFAVLFFAERSQRQRRSMEQVSLLPLDADCSTPDR